jgi:NAD(P)-dependent dehydrogenase (short-subunit alcohol dehydrogenase family)
MSTILVTGANRGIGLEHVRQALAAGDDVIAACRSPAAAADLHELGRGFGPSRLRIESLDVASPPSIEALAQRLEGVAIDILINNAGIYGRPDAPAWPEAAKAQSLGAMDYDLWEDTLRINLLGPFRVTGRLLPNLRAGERKLVVMMSSDLGSIANNTLGTSHAYRSSKAALNMVTRGLAIDLKGQGITIISLAPGWTRTDLGGEGAHWPVDDSVRAQRRVLDTITPADSGRFIDLTGKSVPW